MKRFFQPVGKDGSAKKPTLAPPSTDNDKISAEDAAKKQPLKFITWNANSFLLRVKNNWPEFTKFVSSIDPDVIAIQEVRMPAAGSKGGPKNPGELKDDTSSSREEKQIITRALSSPPFGDYRVWWSLSDSKYAGTALFVKKCLQPQKVFFNLDRKVSKHEPDGRVILAEFETFNLLNTYAPNNGWKEEENSFPRRRKWDKRILEFVLQSSDKPLIWCGDLNVSHEEIDVSHPDFFSAAKVNGYVPPNKEDCGQPGFTLNERKRFGSILKEGKLIDAYRHLHKEKDMEHGFSWSGNPIGKYRGKRMRIDYFVVAEKLKDRIVSCEMHGQGIELQGFYGSDHCPVSLVLSEGDTASKETGLPA
ncbi:DNA-(apurinic or apyrimidinic site) endonuclease [Pyrus x bretschneideri]|uniref:DNA-(apurinic or apyrimidinic site) endonuclease n=1 Tax=Pyrus x bretschneideri TaxID=225117 RepID=UPI00202FEC18|nr:DNA-(apurinic or apyrimidinic site) endonuclease [Pyrus x bretschneideri]